MLTAIDKHTGHTLWTHNARPPLRLHARRHRRTPSTPPCSRPATAQAPGASSRSTPRPARSRWSRDLPSPSESSPLRRPRPRLLRLPERHRLRAERAQRQRRSGPTTPPARSRRARRSPTACSTSATTPGTCRRSPSGPAAGSGAAAPKARCSAAAPSTRPPPSIYGRVFLGNTDGRVYAYDASTGTPRLGRADRRLRLRLARRHERPRPRPDDLRRLLRRHLLRAQRPLRAHQLEVQRARADLRLGHDRRPHRLLRRPRPAHAPTASASPPAASSSQMDTGSFDPVISDGKNIYLTGHTGLYGSAPLRGAAQPRHEPPGAERPRRARSAPPRPPARVASSVTAVQPPGPCPTQPLPCGERPVAREVHAHEEVPRRARLQREGVVSRAPSAARARTASGVAPSTR